MNLFVIDVEQLSYYEKGDIIDEHKHSHAARRSPTGYVRTAT